MKAGTRLTLTNPTHFDERVGLKKGMTAIATETTKSQIIEVKFEDWKHPHHPLFHDGSRMMLAKCFRAEKSLNTQENE